MMPTKTACVTINGEAKNVELSFFGLSFYMSHAAGVDDLDAVKVLMRAASEHGFEILAHSEKREHILLNAVSARNTCNQYRVATYLLEIGINPTMGNSTMGWTPLHTLCNAFAKRCRANDQRKHILDSIVRFEIKSGEDIMHFTGIDSESRFIKSTPYELLADDYKKYYDHQKQHALDEQYECSRAVADDVQAQDIRQAFSQEGSSATTKQGLLMQIFSSIFGSKSEVEITSAPREMPMSKIKVK